MYLTAYSLQEPISQLTEKDNLGMYLSTRIYALTNYERVHSASGRSEKLLYKVTVCM